MMITQSGLLRVVQQQRLQQNEHHPLRQSLAEPPLDTPANKDKSLPSEDDSVNICHENQDNDKTSTSTTTWLSQGRQTGNRSIDSDVDTLNDAGDKELFVWTGKWMFDTTSKVSHKKKKQQRQQHQSSNSLISPTRTSQEQPFFGTVTAPVTSNDSENILANSNSITSADSGKKMQESKLLPFQYTYVIQEVSKLSQGINHDATHDGKTELETSTREATTAVSTGGLTENEEQNTILFFPGKLIELLNHPNGKWKGSFETRNKNATSSRQSTSSKKQPSSTTSPTTGPTTTITIPEEFVLHWTPITHEKNSGQAVETIAISPKQPNGTTLQTTKQEVVASSNDEMINDAPTNDKKESKSQEMQMSLQGPQDHMTLAVNGQGTNQYGTFQLIGSYNVQTQLLSCTKQYVATPIDHHDDKILTKPVTSNTKSVTIVGASIEEGHETLIPNDNTKDNPERPYQTRKRQMSWKRRATYEEYSVASTAGGHRKQRQRSESHPTASTTPSSNSNTPTASDMMIENSSSIVMSSGSSSLKLKSPMSAPVTSKNLIDLSSQQHPDGETRIVPPLPLTETGDGDNLSNAAPITTTTITTSTDAVTAIQQSDSITINTNPASTTISSTTLSPSSTRKRSQSMFILGSSKSSLHHHNRNSGATAAGGGGSNNNSTSNGTNSVSGTGHHHHHHGNSNNQLTLKLPSAGDPMKARWRAAHYLYYHRPTAADMNYDYGMNVSSESNGITSKNEASAGANKNASNQNNERNNGGGNGLPPKFIVYEGEMYNTLRHGRGVCYYSTLNLLYEGEWVCDLEHGHGRLMSSNRKHLIYVGEWERGRMHGAGTYYYTPYHPDNGPTDGGDSSKGDNELVISRYEGEFKENLRHGNGTYILPDGSRYSGQWQNGYMCGRGTFTWPDKSTYDGEWKDGKRHGLGLLKVSDGFIYDGSWVYNSMDGRGSATYPNGQQYDGSFSRGRREGRGTILFTNGAIYEGRFRDDMIDGQGTMKMSRTALVVPSMSSTTTAPTTPSIASATTQPIGEQVQIDATTTPMEVESTNEKEKINEATMTLNVLESAPIDEVTDLLKNEARNRPRIQKYDFMIPVSFQSDMGHIHRKAGFTQGGK